MYAPWKSPRRPTIEEGKAWREKTGYKLGVFLYGYTRRRKWGLPKGTPFVLFIHAFLPTEGQAAAQYARILEATTGYSVEVSLGFAPYLGYPDGPFYSRWFFS